MFTPFLLIGKTRRRSDIVGAGASRGSQDWKFVKLNSTAFVRTNRSDIEIIMVAASWLVRSTAASWRQFAEDLAEDSDQRRCTWRQSTHRPLV